MSSRLRSGQSFVAGSLMGTLGGLIGLGGAEFRLPMLVGMFKLPTLEAIILNKAMSLVVVGVALIFRAKQISFDQQLAHIDVSLNLLAGSLIGAWWPAGHAMTMPGVWLNRIMIVLLAGLSLVMLSEAKFDLHHGVTALIDAGLLRWRVAGSILGAAVGGLLMGLIPTNLLMTLLGLILLISAVKTFQHAH